MFAPSSSSILGWLMWLVVLHNKAPFTSHKWQYVFLLAIFFCTILTCFNVAAKKLKDQIFYELGAAKSHCVKDTIKNKWHPNTHCAFCHDFSAIWRRLQSAKCEQGIKVVFFSAHRKLQGCCFKSDQKAFSIKSKVDFPRQMEGPLCDKPIFQHICLQKGIWK